MDRMDRFLERMRESDQRDRVAAAMRETEPVAVELPVERAAQSVHLAIADFTLAILEAKTMAQAHEVVIILSTLQLAFEATVDAALYRREVLREKVAKS